MLNRIRVGLWVGALAVCGLCGAASAQVAGNGFSREVAKGPGVFNGPANDAPVMRNPMPPLSEIPPMPMPFPAMVPVNGQMANSIVVCDAETGKSEVIQGHVVSGLTGDKHEGRFPVEGEIGSEGYGSRSFSTLSPITTQGTFPWSPNCKVAMRFLTSGGANAWYVCSGTMIDWSTVLMAGHCVYNHGNGLPDQWAQEVYVFPGWDGVNGTILPPNGPGTNQAYGYFGYSRGTYMGAGGSWISSGSRDQD